MKFEDRIETKIDKLDERLDNVDKSLAVYNKQLEIHIEGVQQNRDTIKMLDLDIQPIKTHVAMMRGAGKLVTISATALGVIAGILKLFGVY